MITVILLAIVAVILWIRIDSVRAANRKNLRSLAATFGCGMGAHYDGSVYFYVNDYSSTAASRKEHNQLQEQFALFLKDAGYKFVEQKTEEVHQGMKHEVKVTPAKFVKSKSR